MNLNLWIFNLIFQLLGFGVFVYGIIIFIIIAIKNCHYDDAKKILIDFLKFSHDYELSSDRNYYLAICHAIKQLVGDSRYEELVKLDSFIPLIQFFDKHAGVPSVEITLMYSDDNEKIQLETILTSLTRQFLTSRYGEIGQEVYVSWTKNMYVGFPTLVITYARTAQEKNIIQQMKKRDLEKIITANSDVIDDELELLYEDENANITNDNDERIDLF